MGVSCNGMVYNALIILRINGCVSYEMAWDGKFWEKLKTISYLYFCFNSLDSLK